MLPSLLLFTMSLIPGIGNKTLRTLLEHFGSAEALWEASEERLLQIKGIGTKTVNDLIQGRRTINPSLEWQKVTDQNIRILTFLDDEYPTLLREMPDAPMILFIRGTYNFREVRPMIALVGARKCTRYGEQVAHTLAQDLSSAGYIVVSGLAFGIDSIAHKAVLDLGNTTLAVLAGGTDDVSIAPQTHLPLAHNVMRDGALISEYLPGSSATERTFPARNRIVAGLCKGTVVIEAEERSGALITAHLALDYNREVFAVPGSIFSSSSFGTNRLIKSGAKIVTSVQDILEEFPLPENNIFTTQKTLSQEKNSLSEEENKILAVLSHEPVHVDKIAKAVRLETSSLNSTLGLLEIKGIIRNVGGMHYIKK